jgi:DNA-nicking Smr family endonuclease
VAKKKPRNQNPPKPKEFQVTPFGVLKGVSGSEALQKGSIQPAAKKMTETPENGLELFFQAVSDVQPLRASSNKHVRAGLHPLQKSVRKAEEDLCKVDENTFLEEIGRLKLDSKFTDFVPDEGELQPMAGNRLRQVKRGVVSVNHQLDLHGLTREEALDALPRFLLSAQKKGQSAVLVITGKGMHSSEEPVLHQAVASWLRDAGRTIVLEFAPAPREMGGNGAYVVFLRQISPSA